MLKEKLSTIWQRIKRSFVFVWNWFVSKISDYIPDAVDHPEGGSAAFQVTKLRIELADHVPSSPEETAKSLEKAPESRRLVKTTPNEADKAVRTKERGNVKKGNQKRKPTKKKTTKTKKKERKQ